MMDKYLELPIYYGENHRRVHGEVCTGTVVQINNGEEYQFFNWSDAGRLDPLAVARWIVKTTPV